MRTPKPWSTICRSTGLEIWGYDDSVAFILDIPEDGYHYSDRARANAQLIEKAPEMFSLIKRYYEAIGPDDYDEWHRSMCDIFEEIEQ